MTSKQLSTISEARQRIHGLVQSNFVPAQSNGIPIWGHVQLSSRKKAWMCLVSVRPEDAERAVEFLRTNFGFLSNVQTGS